MGKGFAVVAVLTIVAFLIPFRLDDAARRDWIDDRGEVAAENAGKLGTNKAQSEYPDAPLLVAHPGWFAFGAALVVAIVGTVIVLLAVIAVGQRRV
jgi:hypothetical protein